MPDELAKLRGAGGSPAQAAAKRSRCRSFSGSAAHLRRNQMRHHVAQVDPGQPRVVLLQHRQFARIETEPRHAGIDMQDRRQRAAGVARDRGPGIDLGERAEHRDDVVREIVGFAAGDQSAQHGEHRIGHELADRQGLVQQGDEEVPAAGGVQRRRDMRARRDHSRPP